MFRVIKRPFPLPPAKAAEKATETATGGSPVQPAREDWAT